MKAIHRLVSKRFLILFVLTKNHNQIQMNKLLTAALTIAFSAQLLGQPKEFSELKKEVLAAQNQRAITLQMVRQATSFQQNEMDKILLFADSIQHIGDPKDSIYTNHAARFVRALALYKKGDIPGCTAAMGPLLPYFKANDQELYERGMNFMGLFLIRLHQPDSAISIYEELLQNLDSANYKARLGALMNLGRAYKMVGNYDAAIDYFIAASDTDPSDQPTRLNTFMNIADIFGEMEFYDKALATMRMVNQDELQPMQITMAFYNNFGTLYFQNNQYDSAQYYLQKAVALGEAQGYHHLNVKNRITLSDIEMKSGHHTKALELLHQAEKAASTYPTPMMLADLYTHLAICQMHLQQPDSAFYYLEKIVQPEKLRPVENTKSVFQLYSEMYEMKGNIPLSNQYLNRHVRWYDSLTNSAEIKFLQDAKAKYMLAQKEKSLKDTQDEAALLSQTQKTIVWILISVILLAAGLYWYAIKNRKKLKHTLERNESLNKEIAQNKTEILELKSKALLQIDEIMSIESDGHYLEFYLKSKGKPEIDRNRIKEILEVLPPNKFVQIHKSYVVNIDYIKAKYATKIMLTDGRELPVSRTYKDALNRATGS